MEVNKNQWKILHFLCCHHNQFYARTYTHMKAVLIPAKEHQHRNMSGHVPPAGRSVSSQIL